MRRIDAEFRHLPAGHPAKGPYGLFLNAKENLRGNIVIGLGNRLNVFQDKLVDALTSDSTIDLTLPGQKPCAYFCILSAQDSTYCVPVLAVFRNAGFRVWRHTPGARRRQAAGAGQLPARRIPVDRQAGRLQALDRFHALIRHAMSGADPVRSSACRHVSAPRMGGDRGVLRCHDLSGVNDPTSAKFISEKCGMTTIQVTNNQSPQTPLLSPLQNNIRPYSMTRSNKQRALMQPDEVLRLDNAQCIVLLRRTVSHAALQDHAGGICSVCTAASGVYHRLSGQSRWRTIRKIRRRNPIQRSCRTNLIRRSHHPNSRRSRLIRSRKPVGGICPRCRAFR